MNDNTLHGLIPSEVGKLSLVSFLWLNENSLSGTLPSQLKQCISLRELLLRNNNLNGTIPEIFGNLSDLNLFDVSNNVDLGGEIPSSLWENDFQSSNNATRSQKEFAQGTSPLSNGDSMLSMGNTDVQGTVPDEFCPHLDQLLLDHTNWFREKPKIDCKCCEDFSHCHMWGLGTNMTASCPTDSVNIIASDNFFFDNTITIRDNISNQTVILPVGANTNTTICLSPTGCYGVQANLNESLAYSSESQTLVGNNKCDPVIICGNEIHATHPKREGLNHIMQLGVPSANILNEPESVHYKALCWMINEVNDTMPKDQFFHKYSICDGTLLQRFAMGVTFFSQPYFFKDNFDNLDFFNMLGSMTLCDWQIIVCDEKEVYIESMIIHDSIFTNFVRELGLFYRLKEVDLSGSNLQGTLDPATFTSWPFLERLDLSQNQLEGEIPEELFKLDGLKTIRLHNNTFEGTLPMNTAYPLALGEYKCENEKI